MARSASPSPPSRSAIFVLMAMLLAAAWPLSASAEDVLGGLRAEFQRQTDPVRRAKLFPKLGNALLAEMRKQIQEQAYDRVPPLLFEYRDGAKASVDGLDAAGRDASQHPGGYRELEMHLRQSLHVVNDVIYALPVEDRDALRAPQHDLERLDERLVKALFPSHGPAAKTPPSSSPSHPQR